MNKTELAKQLNKKYQEINTPTDWKTNIKTIIEWENLPATDRVVWERMVEELKTLLKEREKRVLESFIEFACMKKFIDNEEDWNVIDTLKKEYLQSNNLAG